MKQRSQLFKDLYGLLRQVAQKRLTGQAGDGGATSLVHDAYLKLNTWGQPFEDDQHFLATASNVMRQILVDRARVRLSKKRDASKQPIFLPIETSVQPGPNTIEVLLLDELLQRLALFDERAARVTEMRIFLGLNDEEISSALHVSKRTVKRDWAVAKAWLAGEMDGSSLPIDAT
jgi:RNA polymerase sigma factor (TIGR02999 family)